MESMELHARRRKQTDYNAREGAGENLWTEEFDGPVRVRLWTVLNFLGADWGRVMEPKIRFHFKFQLGVEIPGGYMDAWDSIHDYFFTAPHRLVPSLIEAILGSYKDIPREVPPEYETAIQTILA